MFLEDDNISLQYWTGELPAVFINLNLNFTIQNIEKLLSPKGYFFNGFLSIWYIARVALNFI